MTRRAWVFAGGEFRVDDVPRQAIKDTDWIVGVDHGISHCLQAGLIPDRLVGDFDSIDAGLLTDPRLVDVPRAHFPERKNNSDLELALHGLCESGIDCVVLLGVSGGRSDHHLFNWLLLMQAHWPFAVELIDATVHAHLVSAQYPLHVHCVIGQVVSLLPLPGAENVTTHGLEYPLRAHTLTSGSTRGLSNVAVADEIHVSVSAGRLLVFRVNTDKIPADKHEL